MLSPEELLRPRKKVLVKYLHSPYEVGAILTKPDNDRSIHLTTTPWVSEFTEMPMIENHYNWVELDKYPELFKTLHWSQERKPEDLPEYVKATKSILHLQTGSVYKTTEWSYRLGMAECASCFIPALNRIYAGDNFTPATEQEYNNFINEG